MNLLLRLTQFLGIREGEHRRFAWLFAHSLFNGICIAFRLFDLRQGKRLFNLVGTGGVLSSIIGFFLVPVLASA